MRIEHCCNTSSFIIISTKYTNPITSRQCREMRLKHRNSECSSVMYLFVYVLNRDAFCCSQTSAQTEHTNRVGCSVFISGVKDTCKNYSLLHVRANNPPINPLAVTFCFFDIVKVSMKFNSGFCAMEGQRTCIQDVQYILLYSTIFTDVKLTQAMLSNRDLLFQPFGCSLEYPPQIVL